MNYLPFVGFGFYGATSAGERANYFPSWGLLSDLPESTLATIRTGSIFMHLSMLI